MAKELLGLTKENARLAFEKFIAAAVGGLVVRSSASSEVIAITAVKLGEDVMKEYLKYFQE